MTIYRSVHIHALFSAGEQPARPAASQRANRRVCTIIEASSTALMSFGQPPRRRISRPNAPRRRVRKGRAFAGVEDAHDYLPELCCGRVAVIKTPNSINMGCASDLRVWIATRPCPEPSLSGASQARPACSGHMRFLRRFDQALRRYSQLLVQLPDHCK